MAHDKLLLLGHVHGRPHQLMTSSYSWPMGVPGGDAANIVGQFVQAFTPIKIEAVLDNIPGVWYFKDSRPR